MAGINGETGGPYSFKFELSLVCCICIMFAPSDAAGKSALCILSYIFCILFDIPKIAKTLKAFVYMNSPTDI